MKADSVQCSTVVRAYNVLAPLALVVELSTQSLRGLHAQPLCRAQLALQVVNLRFVAVFHGLHLFRERECERFMLFTCVCQREQAPAERLAAKKRSAFIDTQLTIRTFREYTQSHRSFGIDVEVCSCCW